MHNQSLSKHAEKLVQISNYFIFNPFKRIANEPQYPTDKNIK